LIGKPSPRSSSVIAVVGEVLLVDVQFRAESKDELEMVGAAVSALTQFPRPALT
jgi:hypothetical protein